MNKIVIGISLVVGLYLVSFATAENVDVPVQVHDSVPHHQAPSHVAPHVAPHGDHTGVPFEGNSNCAPSDAHRTDVPLDVPTGAPLLDVPADAPQAERDKMTNYLNHLLPKDDKPADELWVPLPPRTPMTGTFPCDVPANS